MKRFDLRHLGADFLSTMGKIIESSLQSGEVGIFIYELGEFSNVAKSADFVQKKQCEILNSVRFNHCDWTLVGRKGNAKSIIESATSNQNAQNTDKQHINKAENA